MAKTAAKLSPFAPSRLPEMPAVPGVRLAACEAGIRYQGRTDLMLAAFEPGTTVAGVLTRSKTCSAPVLWCRAGLEHGRARALVVNSGNANAFTGKKGRDATRMTAEAAARAVGCGVEEVYLASTGVIGEPLDAGRFVHLLGDLAKSVKPDAFEAAARAIMTTDTYAKLATRTAEIGGVPVVINGFCKGAGMMAPDMATMLCFIFTDAAISQPVLQGLLAGHADTTFNCMTVDGDTSTSDTCLLFATGAAAKRGQKPVSEATDPRLAAFGAALHDLLRDLAIQVAKDGEGMSKFVTFEIGGAESWAAARTIALALRQLADREGRHFRRGSELGPHRHGDRESRRGGRPRQALDLVRPAHRRPRRRACRRVRGGDGRGLYEGPRDRHSRRCRGRLGQRHGLDLRPHPRLHLDQRGLSQLRAAISASLTSMAVNDPS